MKSNEALQKDVQETIKWEPLLNKSQIEVTAIDGTITLDGFVDLYAKKILSESATKDVKGVKGVINKIQVNVDSSLNKSDDEISIDVKKDLASRLIPTEKLKVKVKDGWVTLEGELHWNYQREIAKNAGNYIVGIKGITSNIKLELETPDQIEKEGIENSLARNPILNKKNIQVKVLADRVTLIGTVDSLHQKNEIERIVWMAPGVWLVDSKLQIDPNHH